MQFNDTEIQVLEAAKIQAAKAEFEELDALKLTHVGGGNVIIIIG